MARATEAKVQFLAKMSHELRTPLQSIAGYVELLRSHTDQPLSDEQARMLARISESEEILVHIIDDVITISRLEAGHVTYHIMPVCAADAMNAAQHIVSPLAMRRGIRLAVDATNEPLMVDADPEKVRQILVNLTANAVKFTRPPGTVTLGCRRRDRRILFDVADTGPGISPDKLRQIFEPYVQVGQSTLDAFGGSGLGLTISREFARAMGGEVSAASRVAQGSVFTLDLPAHGPL